jgi:uncharacterized protein
MDRPMRILGMADLHGSAERLTGLEDLDADLIAFCGDLHNDGTPEEAMPVAEALASLGPPVLIVPGNMDPKAFVLDLWKDVGLKVMHARSCRSGEIGFVGFGGMAISDPVRISDPKRFYLPMENAYESLSTNNGKISGSSRKVVLSHQPPRGACDVVYSGESVGCLSLRRYVDDFCPDLLICGHIHEDRGKAELGKTTVVNVGETRQGYAALIKLDEQIKVEWIEP